MGIGAESALFTWLRGNMAGKREFDRLLAELHTTNQLLARIAAAVDPDEHALARLGPAAGSTESTQVAFPDFGDPGRRSRWRR